MDERGRTLAGDFLLENQKILQLDVSSKSEYNFRSDFFFVHLQYDEVHLLGSCMRI